MVPTEEAVGHVICHDMTQIIPGQYKDARFRKGHIVQPEDIPVLLDMGKEHLYVYELDEGMLHEDEAAEILRDICKNDNMSATGAKEGKIELKAECSGLFTVDVDRLLAVNSIDELMIATRHTNTVVKKGDKLAGTRVIPLVIRKEKLEQARAAAGETPLLTLTPFRLKTAGIITTGNEVRKGRIEDKFTPVLKDKLAALGIETVRQELAGDDDALITRTILEMKEQGLDLVLCSGGMSVDPDDRTPGAIKATGAEIVTYGAPVLPGAMFLLAYLDGMPVMGLPGCVMYAKATVFDLVLPRVAAGLPVTKRELAGMGHGGLCLGCAECHYPICPFGKGV